MLLFRLGCLRKYAEICFGKLSKICDMCKIFFTGLFFILWGVDQNSDPVMVLNRFGMMDIGVADECGSTLYFGRSDEVPGNVFQYCSNLIVFDRQGGILESYRLDTDLIALCMLRTNKGGMAIGYRPEITPMFLCLSQSINKD